MVYGRLRVRLVKVRGHGDIVERKMEIADQKSISDDKMKLRMIQLMSWPTQGLPYPTAIMSLIEKLTKVLMNSPSKQTVVMCRFVRIIAL